MPAVLESHRASMPRQRGQACGVQRAIPQKLSSGPGEGCRGRMGVDASLIQAIAVHAVWVDMWVDLGALDDVSEET